MALPKPEKSKAPAPTAPVGGYHNEAAASKHGDPCCLPGGAGAFDERIAFSGADGAGDTSGITSFVLEPGAH